MKHLKSTSELEEVLNKLSDSINDEGMTELNYLVEKENKDPLLSIKAPIMQGVKMMFDYGVDKPKVNKILL